MRRNHTLHALAAGAGAAAVLLAAAGPALALENAPFEDSWQQGLVDGGYVDVSCIATPLQGNQDSIYFDEEGDTGWGSLLEEGNDWALVVLKVADAQEGQDWKGYGEANVYQHSQDGNITHVMLCQGNLDGAPTEEPTDEPTDEPTEEPTDEPTEEPTEEPTDEPTETEEPTGPPVETDGISSGPNVALLGGAALVLAGAGAAGFAMRRRDGGAH